MGVFATLRAGRCDISPILIWTASDGARVCYALPMSRNTQKISHLGKLGEELAFSLLSRSGFTEICNLNEMKTNHEDADFLATKDGRRFFISVKARNKCTNRGTLNPRYKLHNNRTKEDALDTARSLNAEYAWLVVQVERATFSAYFGTHAQLLNMGRGGGEGVLMAERHTRHYLALAQDERHDYEYALFSNQQ